MTLTHEIKIGNTICPVIKTAGNTVHVWHYGQRAVLYGRDKLVTRNFITGKVQSEKIK